MSEHAEGSVQAKGSKQKGKVDTNGWPGPPKLASGLYHDGGVGANRAGLQLARIGTLYTSWIRRKRPIDADLKDYVAAYERDGVLVMENFLPDDVFASVLEECRRAHEEGLYGSEDLDDGLVEEGVSVNKYKRDKMSATWK